MMRGAAPAGTEGALRVLVFEAEGHLFAVRAEDVSMVLPGTGGLPPGTRVVDAVGLLSRGERADRGCAVLLRPANGQEAGIAITATRAKEVALLDAEKLLPLPTFLFNGANPFLGVVTGAGGAVFLLAEPERLIAAAGAR
jgi:hypothetical protein